MLIALDDDDAKQALADLGDEPDGEHHKPDVLVFANLAAAARGDLAALGSLCDEALRLLHSGESDPIEALTAGELYARLASVSGDADQMRCLAGVLLKRAEFEYREGWATLADNAVAEATVLLFILVDTGDPSMGAWLSILVTESPLTAIATAARYRPTILKFIEPQGTC